jgi:protein-L-isoaspartate(D-aspartate) O-methyltransferase
MIDFASARKSMVAGQIMTNGVRRASVIQAMLYLPREVFVPEAFKAISYSGKEIPLSEDRALLEPMVLGRLLDAAKITNDNKVLDIAAGTGYSTTILSFISENVTSLESYPHYAETIRKNVKTFHRENVTVVENALSEGYAANAPYDLILINGAVDIIPQTIIDQLSPDGRLITVFNEGLFGKATICTPKKEGYHRKFIFDCGAVKIPDFAFKKTFTL